MADDLNVGLNITAETVHYVMYILTLIGHVVFANPSGNSADSTCLFMELSALASLS